MKKYDIKTFDIKELKGLSAKNIEEHLKLYTGYVNNMNMLLEKIAELSGDEKSAYALSEMQRRFSFEFNGMKNHELFFESLSVGASSIKTDGELYKMICEEWGSFENWLARFKNIAKTRGVGWAMLYLDKENNRLINGWVDEQHLGHLLGLKPVLALDMWEHSFVFDYQPSGKPQYIEDFFENVNWNLIEEKFLKN